jgi:hypothetical protein
MTDKTSIGVNPPTPPVTGVANGGNKGTKVDLQTCYLALISGLMAYYQPGDGFLLAAGALSRDELIASFQRYVASAETTKASNQVWRADVQKERAAELAVRPLRAGLKSILEGRFGKSGTELVKFGFTPAKASVKTAAVKTAAAVKAEATRKARGTRGSVQKKKVTGDVTGVVITPVTAEGGASTGNGGAPAASASPAATGGTLPPHA